MYMDRRFLLTVTAVALVVAGAVQLATLPDKSEIAPLQETISGVEHLPEMTYSKPDPGYAYMVREYEGRVAVFTADNPSQPEMVLETLVQYLPDYDRTQMQQGIPVKDYKELVTLIEDFVS